MIFCLHVEIIIMQPSQVSQVQSATLYVGDLHPSVTQKALYDEFSTVGGVTTVHVCTDRNTSVSMGYGYVNFRTIEDAERALNALNFKEIGGQSIRLMWSNRDPTARKSSGSNLFVRGLPDSVDSKRLHDLFSQIGNILSSKVVFDEDGRPRNYGYVQMATEEDSKRAMEQMTEIDGSQISVTPFVRSAERGNNWTNCYFKFLPRSYTEEQAREFFTSTGGEVTSYFCPPPREPIEGAVNQGYGYVNFATNDQAMNAIETLNGHIFDENRREKEDGTMSEIPFTICKQVSKRELARRKQLVRERRRREMQERFAGRNLYLKNLPEDYGDDQVREMFSPFGEVQSVRIVFDPMTGGSRGVGFVCMGSVEEANRAKLELSGNILPNQKTFYIAIHQSKSERNEYLIRQVFHFKSEIVFELNWLGWI